MIILLLEDYFLLKPCIRTGVKGFQGKKDAKFNYNHNTSTDCSVCRSILLFFGHLS